MLMKFKQNRMIRTKFGGFWKKKLFTMLTIFDMSLAPVLEEDSVSETIKWC